MMIKRLLSLLLIAVLAHTAPAAQAPAKTQADNWKRPKKRLLCHLTGSSKIPRELDLTFSKALHPSVYSLFRFAGRPGPPDRRIGHELRDWSPGLKDLLKGPVKSVRNQSEYRNSRLVGKWDQTFDPAGNLTGEFHYRGDGSLSSQYIFEYDAAGRKKAETDLHYDPCHRDSRWVYRYDEATGRLAELQKYDPETGQAGVPIVYTYSPDGRTVRESERWGDNRTLLLREFSQGEAGIVVTGFSRKEGGSRVSDTYDARGRLVRVVSYENPDAPAVLRSTYEYDADGRLGEVRGSWPSATYVKVYGYNAEGDLMSMRQYAADGSFRHGERYSYEYDARGNWIKRTAWYFSAGQEPETPGRVSTRAITYY